VPELFIGSREARRGAFIGGVACIPYILRVDLLGVRGKWRKLVREEVEGITELSVILFQVKT
jgi:hypothetical protein